MARKEIVAGCTKKSPGHSGELYTFDQWSRLTTYLDHGEVTPDNNAAENAVRPFVIGRKNWLFAGFRSQRLPVWADRNSKGKQS